MRNFGFVVCTLLLSGSVTFADEKSRCQVMEPLGMAITQLRVLPGFQREVVQMAASLRLPPVLLNVLVSGLGEETTNIVAVTPEVALKLELAPDANPFIAGYNVIGLMPNKSAPTKNASIRFHWDSEIMDASKSNLVITDLSSSQNLSVKALQIKNLFHEMGHAHMFPHLNRLAPTLGKRIPRSLYRENRGRYEMHPHLYEFVQEWVALAVGFASYLGFWRTYIPAGDISINLEESSANGDSIKIKITGKNIAQVAKDLAIKLYAISDHEVLEFIKDRTLQDIIGDDPVLEGLF